MLPSPTAEPIAAMMKTVLFENRPRSIGAFTCVMAGPPPLRRDACPYRATAAARVGDLLDGARREPADDVLLQPEEQRHDRDRGDHGAGCEHRVVRVRLLRDVAEEADREREPVWAREDDRRDDELAHGRDEREQ